MRYQITATVKLEVDVPSVEDIDPLIIPSPYTPEEWHDVILENEIESQIGNAYLDNYSAKPIE